MPLIPGMIIFPPPPNPAAPWGEDAAYREAKIARRKLAVDVHGGAKAGLPHVHYVLPYAVTIYWIFFHDVRAELGGVFRIDHGAMSSRRANESYLLIAYSSFVQLFQHEWNNPTRGSWLGDVIEQDANLIGISRHLAEPGGAEGVLHGVPHLFIG